MEKLLVNNRAIMPSNPTAGNKHTNKLTESRKQLAFRFLNAIKFFVFSKSLLYLQMSCSGRNIGYCCNGLKHVAKRVNH